VPVDFYTGTNGAGWTNSTIRTAPRAECTWFGAVCGLSGTTVTGMSLGVNNLTGTLPPTLNNFKNLQTFLVEDSQLTGPIPSLQRVAHALAGGIGGHDWTKLDGGRG
jgi:hypothetical protein